MVGITWIRDLPDRNYCPVALYPRMSRSALNSFPTVAVPPATDILEPEMSLAIEPAALHTKALTHALRGNIRVALGATGGTGQLMKNCNAIIIVCTHIHGHSRYGDRCGFSR